MYIQPMAYIQHVASLNIRQETNQSDQLFSWFPRTSQTHPFHFITHNLTLRCYAARDDGITVTQDVTQFTAVSTRFVQDCLVIAVKLSFPQYCSYSVSISLTMHALSHSKHFLIIY